MACTASVDIRFRLFDKNNAMNFMGEDITFKQFMEGDFETKEGVKLE